MVVSSPRFQPKGERCPWTKRGDQSPSVPIHPWIAWSSIFPMPGEEEPLSSHCPLPSPLPKEPRWISL